MSGARDEILGSIRKATGDVLSDRKADYDAIPREYRRTASLEPDQVIECFIDRLHDYGSGVFRCSENEIPENVSRVLRERGNLRLLASPDFPSAWLPNGFDFLRDEELSYSAISEKEGVVTACAVAIALTGTIILQHRQERRALTLIPDYHLCVVFEGQVVETVPEGMRRVAGFGVAPLTTISGPSATADIEMTRIKGVHGPRTLDVILVRS